MAKGVGEGGRGGRGGGRGGATATEVRDKLEKEFDKYAEEHDLPELTGGYTYGETHPDHVMEIWNEPGTAVWGVRVNEDFVNSVNIDDWVAQNHETGWLAARNLDELVTHEAGHYVYRMGLTYSQREAVSSAFRTSRDQGFKGMSRISEQNASEFFSEALVLTTTGRLRGSLDRRTFGELKPVFDELGIDVQ